MTSYTTIPWHNINILEFRSDALLCITPQLVAFATCFVLFEATCCFDVGTTLTEEALSSDDPDGKTALVHSVCVRADSRRKGLASRLMSLYIEQLKKLALQGELDTVMLCCKDCLVDTTQVSNSEVQIGHGVASGQKLVERARMPD
eukprot:5861242-Amphidinium_carterae.1